MGSLPESRKEVLSRDGNCREMEEVSSRGRGDEEPYPDSLWG